MHIRYAITGLTCESCVRTVRELLLKAEVVEDAHMNLRGGYVDIDIRRTVAMDVLQTLLSGTRYTLSSWKVTTAAVTSVRKFAPLILMFAIVLSFTGLMQLVHEWNLHLVMLDFMGGFFVVFGILKLANLKGFARSYAAYDDLAARVPLWGLLYPFVELLLGVLFLTGTAILAASVVTAVVMTQKAYSVFRNVRVGNHPWCACLGGFFAIPITWVTFGEDVLMALMGAVMVWWYVL